MEDSPKMSSASGNPGEDVHALMRADEIRRDKKRFGAVRKHVKDASRSIGMKGRKSRKTRKTRKSRGARGRMAR